VLQDFKGSFLVVSHDRFFISRIANKIWWIEDHQIKEYPGTYEEYDWNMKNVKKNPKAETKNDLPRPIPSETPPSPAHAEKEKKKQRQKLEREIQKIEEESTKLEGKKSELHTLLADPGTAKDKEKLFNTMEQLKNLESRLSELTRQWEQKCGELERGK
jgi:ATP-binding cassette subfamily F protein 3